MITTLLWLAIYLFVLGIVASVLVWLVRYLEWPAIVAKFIIAFAVLAGLVILVDAFTGRVGTGVYYRGERVDVD